jgi:hypothetical protein
VVPSLQCYLAREPFRGCALLFARTSSHPVHPAPERQTKPQQQEYYTKLHSTAAHLIPFTRNSRGLPVKSNLLSPLLPRLSCRLVVARTGVQPFRRRDPIQEHGEAKTAQGTGAPQTRKGKIPASEHTALSETVAQHANLGSGGREETQKEIAQLAPFSLGEPLIVGIPLFPLAAPRKREGKGERKVSWIQLVLRWRLRPERNGTASTTRRKDSARVPISTYHVLYCTCYGVCTVPRTATAPRRLCFSITSTLLFSSASVPLTVQYSPVTT